MRVFIINGSHQYEQLFLALGYEIADAIISADLVCFTGGADVSPHLYGDYVHATTHSDYHRDVYELAIFRNCRELDIPMVGICRGAQFLNVMSGGRMYQHVSRHTQEHGIEDVESKEIIRVSSTHHQMMMPSSEAVLVAFSTLQGTREWFEKEKQMKDVSDEDVEVVYYPRTNCLCFQPHPEFTGPHYKGMRDYFDSCINRFLMKEED